MLQSLKRLYGNKLGASDGEIGHVKDFYFDDQSWAVRYLVADTGSWLPGRQVLISPHSLGTLDPEAGVLRVSLTRQQVENSPSIETHKPVSRQYEEEYYRYFGWPGYWQGDQLWGLTGFPILAGQAAPPPGEPARADGSQTRPADPHLRSAQDVTGYHLRTVDATIGHVGDFLMDPRSWAIGQLVVKTGHRLTGREVLISAGQVDRISYDDSTVFVNLTGADIENSPAYELEPAGAQR